MSEPNEIRIPAEESEATMRIQSAIDKAAEGPVRVVLERGRHVSGGLKLISDVELHLAKGAELCFIPTYEAYQHTCVAVVAEESNRAMLVAADAARIALTGKGRIVCDHMAFATGDDTVMGTRIPAQKRPRVLVFDGCDSVMLSGLSIVHSPMWTLHFVNCTNIAVDNVHVDNDRRMPNTDGIVIDGCRDVTITNCDIRTADDGIVLKTSIREDGSFAGTCERVRVADCRVLSRSCALKIGTESFADFKDLVFEDCEIIDSNRGLGIFSRDGGTVKDVRFSHIKLDCRETPDGFWGSGEGLTINVVDRKPDERPAGVVSGVVVERISGTMEGAINLYAERAGGIENIRLNDINISQNKGVYGSARSYDLRPTFADLTPDPDAGGRMNAWRKGADGRVIGLIDYPNGMPGVFARNVEGLEMTDIAISRPDPLPESFNIEVVATD